MTARAHVHSATCACFSRRNLFGLIAGGVASLALPRAVMAGGHAEALVLNCMDYRLVDEGVQYFNARGLRNNYDQVILAGASVGALGKISPEWAATFWKHVETAQALHNIKKIIAIAHRDCGAFKIVFGADSIKDRDMETALHRSQMILLRQEVAMKFPTLGFEAGLMSLNGAVENLFPGDGARVDFRPKPKPKPKPPTEQTAAVQPGAQPAPHGAPADPHAATHAPSHAAPAPSHAGTHAAPATKPAPVSAHSNVPIESAAPPPAAAHAPAHAPAHSPAHPAAVGSSAHGAGHGH